MVRPTHQRKTIRMAGADGVLLLWHQVTERGATSSFSQRLVVSPESVTNAGSKMEQGQR